MLLQNRLSGLKQMELLNKSYGLLYLDSKYKQMKHKQINTFVLRLTFIFFIHFIFKTGDQSFNSFSEFTYRGGVFSVFFIIYWLLVWYIASFFHKKIQKKQENTVKNKKTYPFLIFLFHLLFGLLVSFLLNYFYRIGDLYLFNNVQAWADVPIFNPELTLGLLTIYMMVFTFDSYYHASIKIKEDQLQMEKLKQENTLAQYLNLKSQIEPHFLFNSLSVLSSVIHTDANLASEFTIRLSRILRYVIEKNEFLLVPLSEEITFVENYLFLIQTRFDKGIIFDNTIDNEVINSSYIPPSSLQLLIENAIKHNKFSDESPLQIKMYNDGNSLVVSNNLNIRNDIENSTNMGLDNLTARFTHFSDNQVIINKTDNDFTVTLPILTNKHYERTNI